MEENVISKAFDSAIKKYLESKKNPDSVEFNTFSIIVIRQLCLIYDELDIITPYLTKSGYAFDNNLAKYGYELDKIADFKEQFAYSDDSDKKHELNHYFISIQKIIIDMYMCKKDMLDINETEKIDFYNLLYTPSNKNPLQLSYNFMNSKNIFEIDDYFKEENVKHQKVEIVPQKVLLDPEVYPILGYSLEMVNSMNAYELNQLNHKIYAFFNIKETAINKEYLLSEAIENYKKENDKVTTGNGYVDILLVMSIITTVTMLATIITMILT